MRRSLITRGIHRIFREPFEFGSGSNLLTDLTHYQKGKESVETKKAPTTEVMRAFRLAESLLLNDSEDLN